MKEDALPLQTPLFHALEKDRYRRREQIGQIEEATGRRLLVYIASLNHPAGAITHDDILAFADLVHGLDKRPLDLMLQSAGGDIDAAEKIVYMLRDRSESLRVIVPESAKSAATLIALAANTILMGITSELGPIDPQVIVTTPAGGVINRPAQSFLDGLEWIKGQEDPERGLSQVFFPLLGTLDPALLDLCQKAIERAKQFAAKWLKRNMLRDDPEKAEQIAHRLCDVKTYLLHGTVIDAEEAQSIGLNVERLELEDPIWERLWRLYCEYEVDMRNQRLVKLFESERVSIPVPAP